MMISSIVKDKNTDDAALFRKKMLDWYDRHARVLPWRSLAGARPDPYHVWLSEVMLQQTTVPAVIPYFLKFIQRWPSIHDLAQASHDDLMSAWAGLGYYARARNLHKCAKLVSQEMGGVFPQEIEALKKLPGIGDYTGAAIASIAYDQPAVVVDGNIERVMARYHAYAGDKRGVKDLAACYAGGFNNRPGDYAQSLMDLGATICTPKKLLCPLCPLNEGCLGYQEGDPALYPVRPAKKDKQKRYGYVYWIKNNNGNVLVHKRPSKGLLGGMYGLPTSDWVNNALDREHLEFDEIAQHGMVVTHVFTHFELFLEVYTARLAGNPAISGYEWKNADSFEKIGFPSLFQKVVKSVSS